MKGRSQKPEAYSVTRPHSNQDVLVDQALEERPGVADPAPGRLEVVCHINVVLGVRRRRADLGLDGGVGKVRRGGGVALVRVDVELVEAADKRVVEVLLGGEAGVPADELVVGGVVRVAVLHFLLDAGVVGRIPQTVVFEDG